jgi:NitT/TauT family transport system ATP-binding protein
VSDEVHVLSHGPRATIRARHAVDIPRPRNVLQVRRHPDFGPLLQTLWDELAGEPPEKGTAT